MKPDPACCVVFLFASFVVAGAFQVAWLKSSWSAPFNRPLDGGRTWAGQPLLGRNKTWRGFLIMVPSVGLSFAIFGGQRHWFGEMYARGLWSLSPIEYFALGCWVGWAFMFAELPNSFCKRRLGIPPGEAAPGTWGRAFWLVVDRTDSLVGALIALTLIVPVPLIVWTVTIMVGVVVHGLFSALLMMLGVKARAA